MSRFKVTWNYSTMKSTFTGINATDGVFGVTVESEWKAVPRKSFAQRLLVSTLLARPARYVNPKMKFSMMGSLHKYFFDVRSTGISSCHVAISDNVLLALPDDEAPIYVMEFDLPTTAEDGFTQALEKVGGERAKHPYYDIEKLQVAEDVSLRGSTTRIAFHGVDH